LYSAGEAPRQELQRQCGRRQKLPRQAVRIYSWRMIYSENRFPLFGIMR